MIKVYEGITRATNEEVRHWLSFAGAKFYRYKRGDCTLCDLKATYGAKRTHCLVVNNDGVGSIVENTSSGERDRIYKFLKVERRARRED